MMIKIIYINTPFALSGRKVNDVAVTNPESLIQGSRTRSYQMGRNGL